MRSVLLTASTTLLVIAMGGAAAARASAGDEQKGWEKIIVPADDAMVKSLPSPRQLRYQMNQYGAFLHYGPAVLMNGDWMSVPDPKVFNPTRLDVEQWVRVAQSFDAKQIVFTAKHHNGFCMWPTQTTDYSVRSSPWRNGRGDLVREVAAACRKHGIALGLYFSGQDRHFPCHALDPAALANREKYWPVYRRQLEELLTNYGDIICLWLDCYGDPFYWKVINPKTGKPYAEEIVALARAKQPNMVIWHGADPDVHGVYLCKEDGTAPYPLWNVVRKGEGERMQPILGPTRVCPTCFLPPWTNGWVIPETYNCHGTFGWVPTTPEKLLQQYYMSVGRGANFLQALVPDKRGLIDHAQANAVAQFGAEVRRRFDSPIARTDSSKGWPEPGVLEVGLGGARKITHVVLEEEIAKGQHVLKYAVDVLADGAWKSVAEGQSIGRKRIERFEPPIAAEKVRLRVVQANAIPSISAMMIYDK